MFKRKTSPRINNSTGSQRLINLKHKTAIPFIAIFAVIGSALLIFSQAAGPYIDAQPENASITAPASTQTDVTASGGSAVKFNSVTTPQGVAACDPSKGYADELCWFNNTGVLNETTTANPYDRWTEAQILAGQASAQMTHVTASNNGADVNGVVILNGAGDFQAGSGTANDPWIYKNRWVDGCIDIQTNNVIIRNVLVRHTNQGWWECHYGAIAADSGNYTGLVVQDTEVDGLYNSCALIAPPRTGCTSPQTYNISSMDMNILLRPALIQRVNSHGSYAFIGYVEGDRIEDSYFHDVGHMHKFPNGDSRNNSIDDFHHDIIWAQGQSNWSITHSFGTQWHDEDPWGGSSGGCLCDQNGNNWVFNNVFMDGQDNVDIAASGTHTKVVALNVYGDHTSAGSVWQNLPTGYSDYGAGAWTPSYSGVVPIIDHSRCTGIYSVTKAGVATKVGC